MKTIVTFLMFACCTLHAQETVFDCVQKTTLLDSLITSNNYSTVFERFTDIKKNCPATENIYKSGEKIYLNRVEMASADREQAIQQLASFYDEFDVKLPNNSNGNAVKKAMLLFKNKLAKDADTYALLDKAFAQNKSAFTDADALYTYFELYFKRYQDPANKLTPGDVLAKVDQIENHVATLSHNADQRMASVYKNVSRSIAALADEVAVCENLLPYYKNIFDSKKQDAVWLQNASDKLMSANCIDDPLFIAIAEAAHLLAPTSASAYSLGIAAFRGNQQNVAAQYFIQSAELNSNPEQKAATYFTLASSVYRGTDKAKAKEFALKALAAQPKYGRAYLFLAQMYGESGDCGETEFEKKAINWLAAQTALQAGVADPKFKSGATKLAESYLKKVPTTDEIRDEKKSGKKITFGCWINETITVPKI